MSRASEVSLAVVPVRAATEMARLPPPVRRLLKLCDGTRTRDALCAAGILPQDQAARALERLLTLGVVEEVSRRRRRLTPQGVAWVNGDRADEPTVATPESVAPVAAQEPMAPPVAQNPVAAPRFAEQSPVALPELAVEPVAERASSAAATVEPPAPARPVEQPAVAPRNVAAETPDAARNPAATDRVASAVLAAQAALPELRFSDDEEKFFASTLDHLAEYE